MDAQAFEIVKILLDKGLLGGGFAVAAWIGSVALEKHRSRNTLLVELHKRRAESVANAWREIKKLELAVAQLEFAYKDRTASDESTRRERAARFQEAALSQNQALMAILEVRYWMGKEVFDDLKLLTNALTALLHAHVSGTGAKEAKAEVEAISSNMSIERALDHLRF